MKNPLYSTWQWLELREYVRSFYEWTCQRCGKYGDVVHHRLSVSKHPDQALRFDNLELVCDECHCKIHPHLIPRNYAKRRKAAANDDQFELPLEVS